jgi:hypothetical protein
MASIIPDSPSSQLQVVIQWLEGHSHTSDVSKVGATMSEDCVHQILPSSLATSDLDNEDIRMQIPMLIETLRDYTVYFLVLFDCMEIDILLWNRLR